MRSKNLLLICTFLFSFISAMAQNFDFAKQAGGTGIERGQGIAVDSAGNTYITGFFQGVATFGNTTLTSAGEYNIFIAKYDRKGNVVWAKQAGGSNIDIANGIAVDPDGNSYVTGNFTSTATFGNITLTSTGSNDVFIAKYDANGNVAWAKQAGGSSGESGLGIAVDAAGNSYVTGYFRGTATFGSTTLTSAGDEDIFIAKYDASGNIAWAKNAGGSLGDYGYGIAVDTDGNSYITGSFRGTATFGSITLTSTYESPDVFIAKYDTNGNAVWIQKAGGISADYGREIAVDASGNSYITGYFQGTVTFGSIFLAGAGYWDIFVAKYDVDGNVVWVQKAGGRSSDSGTGIGVDVDGNSYVTGYFQGTVIFGDTTLTSDGSSDIFIAKYDTSGNVVWVQQAGGGSADHGYGIAVDAAGNSYATGYFFETATFGSTTLTSAGSTDVFIAKISEGCSGGPVNNTNTGKTYCSIQEAIDDVETLDGHTITVEARTYNEVVTVSKELTIEGPNADVNCDSGRTDEAVVISSGSNDSKTFSIEADNVTINGFTIKNPDGSFGVAISGKSNIRIKNNIITDIGNDVNGWGPSHGINFGATAAASNISFIDNCISDIRGGQSGCPNNINGSVAGIAITESSSTFELNGLNIERNRIADISTCDFNGAGGKGSYGVLINVGANNASGMVTNANISFNDIENLSGRWVHAIGLEGPTPNASVENNDIKDLNAPTDDAAAVFFEDNDEVSSVVVNQNSFSGDFAYGILVSSSASGQLDATGNWWNTTSGNDIADLYVGDLSIEMWLTSGDNDADVGFFPKNAADGTFVVLDTPVTNAENCLADGSMDVSWTGGTAPYTVSWTDGTINDSNVAVATTTDIIEGLAAGTYEITVTDANGTHAVMSGVVVEHVAPGKALIGIKQATICEGESVEINAICDLGTVVWSNGATGAKTLVSPSVTTVYTAKCVVDNCEGAISDEIEVVVMPKPITPVIVTNRSTTVCEDNNTVELSVITNCDNGDFHWLANDVALPYSDASITVSPAATTTYKVFCKSTDVLLCESDIAEVTITVNTNDLIAPTTSEDVVVSEGAITTLTASCAGGTPVWFDHMRDVANVDSPFIIPSLQINTTFTVRCVADPDNPDDCMSAAVTQNVTIDKFGIVNQPEHIYVCDNQNAWFTVGATGQFVTYQWQEFDGTNWYNLTDGGIYSGANTNHLNITVADKARMDFFQYRVIVTNTAVDAQEPKVLTSSEVLLAITSAALAHNISMVSDMNNVTNIYQAVQTIVASNLIEGGNVKYFAGNSMLFEPGFEVEASTGAVFEGKIQVPCTNTSAPKGLPKHITK